MDAPKNMLSFLLYINSTFLQHVCSLAEHVFIGSTYAWAHSFYLDILTYVWPGKISSALLYHSLYSRVIGVTLYSSDNISKYLRSRLLSVLETFSCNTWAQKWASLILKLIQRGSKYVLLFQIEQAVILNFRSSNRLLTWSLSFSPLKWQAPPIFKYVFFLAWRQQYFSGRRGVHIVRY